MDAVVKQISVGIDFWISEVTDFAPRCDERYNVLCSEVAGPALIHRFPEPVQLFPVAGRHVRRQDSELVSRAGRLPCALP